MTYGNKKVIKSIVIICVIIILFISAMYLKGCLPPNKSQVEKDFMKNYDQIVTVTDYLVNSKYESIYISISTGSDTVAVNDFDYYLKIKDIAVAESVNFLQKQGYDPIYKHGHNIIFTKWSLFNKACGVVYSSLDGILPQIQFVTIFEQLSEPNWYYWEEDYNEWRLDHKI